MKAEELQNYLYNNIPITKAMGVEVRECHRNEVVLFAPLVPNINHRETVFGGSACTLAILSAWGLLQVALSGESIAARLVIQHNIMSYEKPIKGDFLAICRFDDMTAWDRFKSTLLRRCRARISISAILQYQGEQAANFEGRFVAMLPEVDRA